MSSADPFVFALDIETDTSVSDEERSRGIETKGLDPAHAAITDVSVTGDEWSHLFTGDEFTILRSLERFLAGLRPGIIVTWNGAVFDLPYLQERYRRHRLDTSLRLRYDPTVEVKYEPIPGHPGGYRAAWGEHSHVDISPLFRAEAAARGVRHSLKPVYESLSGLKAISVDRERMHLLPDAERHAYATSDTVITRWLAVRDRSLLLENVDRP